MRNFFSKLNLYRQRKEESSSPPNTDENISPRLKQSRRWQVMDSTFQWKLALVLVLFLAAIANVPAKAQGPSPTPPAAQEDINDTEAFFRRDKEAQVPIIMYHLVTENTRYQGKHGISPAELKSDLQYLKDNDYNTIVIQDLINFVEKGKNLPKNPIVLTFDDGNASDHKYLFPLLQEFEMKAVISILGKTTDEITQQQAENPSATYPNLTWGQVIEMHKSGIVEVQSHGYNVHGKAGSGKLRKESGPAYHQRLSEDLQKLQDRCQEHLGSKPTTFCYPLGIISKGSHAVLEELGFVASLSCQEGMNIIKQGDNSCLLKLNRVNRASGRSISSILEGLQKKAEKTKA